MLSQADETRCTLLLHVDGELKEVAKGKIVTPLNRISHGMPMPDDVFRVTLSRVLPGCGALDPPHQPLDAETELNLEQCLIWPLIWPKALIRLDASTTPVDGPGRPNQEKDFSPAKSVEDDHDDNADDPNDFFVDDPYGSQNGGHGPVLEPADDLVPAAADKSRCTKRLSFSQEAAPTQQVCLNPGTVQKAVQDALQKMKG